MGIHVVVIAIGCGLVLSGPLWTVPFGVVLAMVGAYRVAKGTD